MSLSSVSNHGGPAGSAHASPATRLVDLALDDDAVVDAIVAPAGAPQWASQLADIGFLPGEPVRVVARGAPGGDPLVVRIADSTFALRRAEAACIQVRLAGHGGAPRAAGGGGAR